MKILQIKQQITTRVVVRAEPEGRRDRETSGVSGKKNGLKVGSKLKLPAGLEYVLAIQFNIWLSAV